MPYKIISVAKGHQRLGKDIPMIETVIEKLVDFFPGCKRDEDTIFNELKNDTKLVIKKYEVTENIKVIDKKFDEEKRLREEEEKKRQEKLTSNSRKK